MTRTERTTASWSVMFVILGYAALFCAAWVQNALVF